MRISIRPSAGWARSSVDLTHRRLEFSLGRFASRVRSLHVRLTDLNGPRGGMDKKCLIAIRLDRPRRLIVVEDVDSDEKVAIGRAADRVARAVARAVRSTSDWRLIAQS